MSAISFTDSDTLGKYTEDRRHVEQTVGSAWQHVCVASLIGHCEALAASGQLTEPSEKSLRFLIAETLSAFGMQSHQQLENELSAVRQCMERA
jgi:hypothetical protein